MAENFFLGTGAVRLTVAPVSELRDESGVAGKMLLEAVEGSVAAIRRLEGMGAEFCRGAGLLVGALRSGGKVLACGNGGSAADAAHFMTELLCRYVGDRPSLCGLALGCDGSFLTAAGNDYGFERVFARQVEGIGRPDDVLVGISTSGNSENVNAAFREAREMGLSTLGLLGRDGGAAAALCDVAIIVPHAETARIQEAHTVLIHAFCATIERELFPAGVPHE
ncbi:D-sedoheptulose 7-phosphate isomerase [soil metagenome]